MILRELAVDTLNWISTMLPDAVGYATIATGALVILSGMAGKGMIKPLGAYAGLLILSVCTLVGLGGG